MDINGILVVISLSAFIFGFIAWIAFIYRRNILKNPVEKVSEINFSQVRKRNENN